MDSFIQPGAFPYYCKKPMWSTEQAVKDEVLVPHRTRHSQGSYSSRHRDVRDVFKVGSCTPSKNEVARVHSLTSHKTPSFYSDSLFPRRRPEHSSYFNVPAGSQLSLPSDSRRKESLTNTTHSLPSSSQQCYDNRAYSADIHEPVSEESSSTDSNSAINDDRRNNVPAQITVQYVSARTSHFHRTTNETNSNLLLPSAEPPRGKPKQYQFQGQLRTPRSYTQHGTAWPNFSDGGGTSSQEDIQLDIIGPDDRRTVSDDAPKKKPCLSVTGWKVLALLFMLITLCLTAAIVAIILGFVKPDNQAVSSIQTTGKPDEVDVVTFNGSMRIRNMTYGPEYEDKTSQKYKSTSVLFCSKVQAVYNNSDLKDSFQTCQVIAYRNGSVIVVFELKFNILKDSAQQGAVIQVFRLGIRQELAKDNLFADESSLILEPKQRSVLLTKTAPSSTTVETATSPFSVISSSVPLLSVSPPTWRSITDQSPSSASPPTSRSITDQSPSSASPPTSRSITDQSTSSASPPTSRSITDQSPSSASPPTWRSITDQSPSSRNPPLTQTPTSKTENAPLSSLISRLTSTRSSITRPVSSLPQQTTEHTYQAFSTSYQSPATTELVTTEHTTQPYELTRTPTGVFTNPTPPSTTSSNTVTTTLSTTSDKPFTSPVVTTAIFTTITPSNVRSTDLHLHTSAPPGVTPTKEFSKATPTHFLTTLEVSTGTPEKSTTVISRAQTTSSTTNLPITLSSRQTFTSAIFSTSTTKTKSSLPITLSTNRRFTSEIISTPVSKSTVSPTIETTAMSNYKMSTYRKSTTPLFTSTLVPSTAAVQTSTNHIKSTSPELTLPLASQSTSVSSTSPPWVTVSSTPLPTNTVHGTVANTLTTPSDFCFLGSVKNEEHKGDCTKFFYFRCVNNRWRRFVAICAVHLMFDPVSSKCVSCTSSCRKCSSENARSNSESRRPSEVSDAVIRPTLSIDSTIVPTWTSPNLVLTEAPVASSTFASENVQSTLQPDSFSQEVTAQTTELAITAVASTSSLEGNQPLQCANQSHVHTEPHPYNCSYSLICGLSSGAIVWDCNNGGSGRVLKMYSASKESCIKCDPQVCWECT